MLSRYIFTPLIVLVLAAGSLSAQDVSLNLQPDYEVIIDGTSNVRDWDAKVTDINAQFVLNGIEGNDLANLRPEHFKSLTLSMDAKSIEADGRRLTNNIQSYLKADDFPVISFELNEVNSINSNGNNTNIEAEGVVTAAGVSHTVTMNVTAERGNNGSIIFSGNQPLKMTDFNIEPPTAMLGAIKAVDDITIIYRVRFIN